MSITYEEALATLTTMFGSPWTEETLDTVLRHHEGHMENTVETVLAHGDGDPQVLLDRLKNGTSAAEATVSMDEELARQLADEEQQRERRSSKSRARPAAAAPRPKPKGRGTPTELPPDFLRVPGQQSGIDADERLARMLQDELFSQELANNPEFAHLSRGRGRPRTVGGQPTSLRFGEMPSRSRASGFPQRQQNGEEGPHIMEKLSEMGESAKKRLGVLAAQWNLNSRRNINEPRGGAGGSSGVASEQRGLLDGDGDDDAFASPHEMEMSSSSMGFGSKKQM